MIIMKKYNAPVIETLALETVDVIAISGATVAAAALEEALGNEFTGEVQIIAQDVAAMQNKWSW